MPLVFFAPLSDFVIGKRRANSQKAEAKRARYGESVKSVRCIKNDGEKREIVKIFKIK